MSPARRCAVSGPVVRLADEESVSDAALPPVALVPWGEGSSAVILQPDAEVADLAAVLAGMPGQLVFTEAFGDVDVVLVFDSAAGPSRREAGAEVRAVLAAGQDPDAQDEQRWMTAGERKAYRAGWDEAFAAVRRIVLDASGAPEGLAPETEPAG